MKPLEIIGTERGLKGKMFSPLSYGVTLARLVQIESVIFSNSIDEIRQNFYYRTLIITDFEVERGRYQVTFPLNFKSVHCVSSSIDGGVSVFVLISD